MGRPRPLSPGEVRLGVFAGRLAIANGVVWAAALVLSAVGPALPGLQRLLRSSGMAGVMVGGLVIASAMTAWLIALYLVGRDPDLSASSWERWTLALGVLNLFAGSLYMALWLRRFNRSARGGAGALVLCGALLVACGGPVDVIEEHWAPDRRHKAVVLTTSGGGVASDLHTSVSVLRPGRDKPGWPPNTFTALHQQDDAPAGSYHGPRITVRWLGPSELEISYDPRASTLRRHEQVDGIRVVYRVAEQDHAPSPGRVKR